MNNVIELKKGEVYFYVGFYDTDLSIPLIHTYTYEGIDPEGEFGHMFLSMEKDVNGKSTYLVFEKEDKIDVVDREKLIKWLQDEHGPSITKRSYVYKIL